MVTNRKTEPTTARPSAIVVDAPRDSFVGVLRRRAAGEDLEMLAAERLARWDELGRQLAASGWHHLEAALETARVAHTQATDARFRLPDPNTDPIETDEAEQLAAAFVDDCRCIVSAGGAEDLWHILATDTQCTHDTLDRIDTEKLPDGDPHECALLLDAARCFALTAFAAMTAMTDRENARRLFGDDAYDALLDAFGPFAVDHRNELEERLLDATHGFIHARSNEDRITATKDYALGMEGHETRYALRPVERMGLVAWLARRGLREIEVTTGYAAGAAA